MLMTDLTLTKTQYQELEKLAFGAFKPLDGFMTEEEFHSVIDHMRLPSNDVFPLPIVLDLSASIAERIRHEAEVVLSFKGEKVGTIKPNSFFTCDKSSVCQKIYGAADPNHPGVAHFLSMGSHFVGGPIHLEKRIKSSFSEFEMTPDETKALFKQRGWQTVVGFQTRNVPHRAHEYLQRVALEQVDGLFIQPLIGRKKIGDYTPEAIMTAYQTMIDEFFPADRVALGILTTSMRYAGPREAIFHAIVRRNYGCTHFIVGRDHAGVGNYYGKYEAHELTRAFDGELGITIMRLHGPYHCSVCDGIVTEHTCPHEITSSDKVTHISGTDMRAMLSGGRQPDSWLMRPDIIRSVKDISLFIEENEL
jgi:sulfate adenylyltransferase